MANTIGEAYLQIRPSMEGIQGEIQEAMGEVEDDNSKTETEKTEKKGFFGGKKKK